MEAVGPPFLFRRPARLRFPAHDPFFEDGDVHRHLCLMRGKEEEEEGPHPQAPAQEEEEEEEEEGMDAWASLASLGGSSGAPHPPPPRLLLQLREAFFCSCCRRSFPSAHLLDLHLTEWHDSLFCVMAQKYNMYQCLVESCLERFKGAQERKEHLVNVHRYPPDFRFDKPLKCKSHATAERPPPRESSVPMELNAEEPREVPEEEEEAMDLGPMEKNREGKEQYDWMEEPLKPSSRSRIPATICFGQGATRSFRSRGKKT